MNSAEACLTIKQQTQHFSDKDREHSGEAKVCNEHETWFEHGSVNRPVSEHVRDQARMNGTESFRSMPRRGHDGICRNMSLKHLQRDVHEFAGRPTRGIPEPLAR